MSIRYKDGLVAFFVCFEIKTDLLLQKHKWYRKSVIQPEFAFMDKGRNKRLALKLRLDILVESSD